jgi:hypothetical protein
MLKTRFIILTTPRSGSTAFRLWLNSHRFIRCHDEVLLKRLDALDSIHHFVQSTRRYEDKNSSYERNVLGYPNDRFSTMLLHDFLDELFNNRETCGPWDTPGNMQDYHPIVNFDEEKAVGIKLMSYSLDNHFLNYWIKSNSVRIIHLVRGNILKQYVSSVAAQKRRLWFSDRIHEPVRVSIDPDTAKDFLQKMEALHTGIPGRFPDNPYTRISYEAFCGRPDKLASGICSFLEVPESAMEMPIIKKLNPLRLSEIVENYSDIVAAFRGGRYEKFLD